MRKDEVLLCQCDNYEHLISFIYDTEGMWEDVSLVVHLSSAKSFWDRVRNAVKYIFGYKSMYGDFDEFLFKPEDYPKIEKVAETLKGVYERQLNNQENKL